MADQTLELIEQNITAQEKYVGTGIFEIAAGKTLKIETSPAGNDILEYEFLDGTWDVTIAVVAIKK